MKYAHILSIPALLLSVSMFTSCRGTQQSSKPAPVKEQASLKIAYVEVDSIMTQYQFAKDCTEILQKKQKSAQATFQSRAVALQREAANLQVKYEAGKLTQQEVQQAQQNLQKKQQQLQNLQSSLQSQYEKQQDQYNKALHDSIQHFLADYNKDMGYDYILSKGQDNILLSNNKLDITEDVIKGLNKRYKNKK